MRFRMQFSDALGDEFVEVRDPQTPTEADEVIEFMRKHADEVWLGESEDTMQFSKVVTLISEDAVRVEVVFE